MSPCRFSLAPERWPPADQELMERLFAGGGLLDERGPLAHVREISRRNLKHTYARWMGWLAQYEPECLKEPPLLRVTPERFRSWILSPEHLAPRSQHTLGSSLLWLLKAAAPDEDWSQHAQVLHRLWRRSLEHRSSRKDGRVISTAVLLNAAMRHSRQHGYGREPQSRGEAKARRDAAIVAFFAVLPIRRRAFVGLELGRSFLVEGAQMVVQLDTSLAKTAEPWETPVPPVLQPILSDYLLRVRPCFLTQSGMSSERLWLNDSGQPYQANHLYRRVSRITHDLVGTPIPPHFFRDCAATTLAYHSPESARLTRGVLGHTTFRIAERHYNQATALEAGRKYSKLLKELREEIE
jgi:integrase